MNRLLAIGILLASLAVMVSGPAAAVAGPGGVAGDWMGALDVGPVKLRLALHIEAGAQEGLTAKLNSVDQGAVLPVDTTTFAEGTLRFAITAIGATYTGTLKEDGSLLEGTWSQSGRSLPLTLRRVAEPFVPNRPQNPRGPAPYESREVKIWNAAAGIHLAGTLVLPEGAGPFPAVVFVSGSGPQDRDETLMGHKPFLVIADDLARHGVASLRCDDRGVGGSEGNEMESTIRDFATDAEAGLAFLTTQPKIDPKAIGILGHSEGGLIAPLVASTNREVAFLVLLAPPGEPLKSLLVRQLHDLLRQGGVADSLAERAMAAQSEDFALLADNTLSRDNVQQKLRAKAAARRSQFTDAERALLRVDAATIEQGIRVSTTPWFRSLLREDPAVYLRTIRIPVLALFGDRDLQVAGELNAKAVRDSLAAAGNTSSEIRILPGLNHLFQHTATGAVADYGTIEETFAPEALQLTSGWIEGRFGFRRRGANRDAR
jgi:pimeloyl-ACP methyl ester carboxylesterase